MTLRAASPSLLLLCICGCGETSAGVHVEVTIGADAFSAKRPFDHVTVVAEGGGQRAVACLFHDASEAEGAAAATQADPCADVPRSWRLPVEEDWVRSDAPRSVNFVFPEGTDVRVRAWAGLGSTAFTEAAEAAATASEEFGPATVGIERAIGSDCDIEYRPANPTAHGFGISFEPQRLCDAACYCDTFGTDCLGEHRSDAVTCVGPPETPRARIANDAGLGCQPPAQLPLALVWHGPSVPLPQAGSIFCKVFVEIEGHFARCAGDGSGACALSADCAPPPTAVGALFGGVDSGDFDQRDVSCLPATVSPLVFAVQLEADKTDEFVNATPAITQPFRDEGACFFELHRISFIADQSPDCGD